MHSGSVERASTPRKRVLSRGMSEDESLRHIIKEAEGSARRLMRMDSRTDSIKKLDKSEDQSEEDLTFSEMLDLQETYNETLQDLRTLELQREVLVFQVDSLQDALERAEEMLAEAQREASDANAELEREMQARKKLEDEMDSLRQQMEKLREVKLVPSDTIDGTGNANIEDSPDVVKPHNYFTSSPMQQMEEESETGPSHVTKEGNQASLPRGDEGGQPPPPGHTLLESSVDSDNLQPETPDSDRKSKETPDNVTSVESPLAKFQRLVQKTFAQLPTLAIVSSPPQDGIIRSSHCSPGEVVTLSSTEQCDSDTLQDLSLGDAPAEAWDPVHESVSPVPHVQSGPEPPMAGHTALAEGDRGSKAGLHPPVPGEPQSEKVSLDPKSHRNPEACALS